MKGRFCNSTVTMLLFKNWVRPHGGFTVGSGVKNPPTNAGDAGSIVGSRSFPGGGSGNLLQYPCREKSMDSGAWWLQPMVSQRVRPTERRRTHTVSHTVGRSLDASS